MVWIPHHLTQLRQLRYWTMGPSGRITARRPSSALPVTTDSDVNICLIFIHCLIPFSEQTALETGGDGTRWSRGTTEITQLVCALHP